MFNRNINLSQVLFRKYIFLIITIISTQSIMAQQDRFQWRVGAYSGVMSYYGDLSNKWVDPNDQLINLFDNTDYISYGLSIEKSLSKSWGLRVMYSKGQFIASDRQIDWDGKLKTNQTNFSRSLNVKTELSDWSFIASYYFDNEKFFGKTAFLAPYLSIGLGWSDYKTKGDLYAADGARYHYWEDGSIRDIASIDGGGTIIEQDGVFETNLRDLRTEGKSYSTSLFHATAGVGLKFRLSNRLNLNLETLVHFTDSDYLDDVSGSYLDEYNSVAQEYAAIPGSRVGDIRGNENEGKDIFAFTSLSLHYNFGQKKASFKAPVIKVGALNSRLPKVEETIVTNGVEEEMLIDTQAIYVVSVEIDSAYLVTERVEIEDNQEIDTIYKVGRQIFTLGDQKQWSEGDDNWDLIRNYFYDEELLLDSLYAISEAAQDTQVLYLVNGPFISTIVVDELDEVFPEETVIDTFYQVGSKFFDDDFSDPLEEEEWKIIRDQYLEMPEDVDPELTYEAYQLEIEAGKELRFDSLSQGKDVIIDTISSNPLSPGLEEIMQEIESMKFEENESLELSLDYLKGQKDSLLYNQLVENDEEDEEVIELSQPIPVVAEEEEKILVTTKVEPTINTIENKELAELRNEIQALRKESSNNEDSEITNLKQKLLLYEMQQKNAEQNTANYNDLKSEIRDLKRVIALQQNKSSSTPTPVIVTTAAPKEIVVANSNNRELAQLQTEVAAINESIDLMKKLMIKQQVVKVVEEVKEQPVTNDGSAAEIKVLRKQVAELNTALALSMVPVSVQPSTDDGVVTELKNQLALLQKQLGELNIKEKSTPIVIPTPAPKMEEVPVKVDIRSLIRGRERQVVFFPIGSASLSAEAQENVRKISQLMLQYDVLDVLLEGYTDASGNAQKNLLLSKKRAESVKAVLSQNGISNDRIVIDYRGADLQSNAAYGRRVELKIQLID